MFFIFVAHVNNENFQIYGTLPYDEKQSESVTCGSKITFAWSLIAKVHALFETMNFCWSKVN